MKILDICKAAMFIAFTWAALTIGLTVREFRYVPAQVDKTLSELAATLAEIRSTAHTANTYAESALKSLSDPRNAKSLQAGLEVAATAKGSLLLLNREMIPRAMRVLDSLNAAVLSANTLVRNTDQSVNDSLLPETSKTLVELQTSLKTVQDETKAAMAAITRLSEDPSIPASLSSIASASAHLDTTLEQVAEASRQLPSIAKSIEKMSKTSSKYQKYIILAQIASALKWLIP